MIKRFIFGTPIETEAVIAQVTPSNFTNGYAGIEAKQTDSAISLKIIMNPSDIVYGLGENVRGMNKRGFKYVSYCTDDPNHSEDKESLYGAHNFLLINSLSNSKPKNLGLFIDTPGRVSFDIGFNRMEVLEITVDSGSFNLYVITNEDNCEDSPNGIIKQFRALIGHSYIAPKWGFGYAQSRWGYASSNDFRFVADNYKKSGIPLDMIYMDIDYMERYKDFTINRDSFPDFEELINEMKQDGIRIIPIIDGGVKIEKGYEVYEEGVKNNYFCKDENGEDFVVGVWPGDCHFPDMLDDEARKWFGRKYKFLLDKGIEGFWNDMNEPAIFYSRKHLNEVFDEIDSLREENLDLDKFFHFKGLIEGINNNLCDYRSFYHNYKGQKYLHDDVHNLFGYYMTRGADEAFDELVPGKRVLMISRSSYIGMHRYSGIWQGDNISIWSHLLMNLKMMPSLNMCGFLYTGADMGGFGGNTSEDLLLRWTAFSIFTPLFRNHSALGSRDQEFFRFQNIDLFRSLILTRYRLVPYLYSEYMKAAKNDSMMFKPLAFEYEEDSVAREIEDQLLLGDEVMIAPVVNQNTAGRVIYFPEKMKELRFENEQVIEGNIYEKGFHYVNIPLGTATLYIRNNRQIPIGEKVYSVDDVNSKNITYYSFGSAAEYDLYDDDGISK